METRNRKPSRGAIARFVLCKTPLIGLVLFAVQFSLDASREITARSPRTPLMQHAVAGPKQSRTIDDLLPVPSGFKRTATPLSTWECDAQGEATLYPRRVINVVLPKNTPTKDIRANMIAVARESFESGTKSVLVIALYPGEFNNKLLPHRWILTFAPHGDWNRLDRIYDMKEYATRFESTRMLDLDE